VTLRLCDTAGIRETDDLVESIGIDRARREIEKCELILAVLDPSKKMSADDEEFYRSLTESGKEIVALYNKCDIDVARCDPSDIFDKVLYVSAKTGEGFEELEKVISDMFIDGSISLYSDAVVMDERQYSSLLASSGSLLRAIEALSLGLELDICSVDIEAAMQQLAELDGREIGEDIVANIFSRFCVGK
jgi:tRNA modification GTPase